MTFFDNHFLFSETYIKDYINEKRKKDEINSQLENAFTQVKVWTKEYTKGDYEDDPWTDYIDAILDVLGFSNKKKIDNYRLLYTNTVTEEEKPVALCYIVEKDEDLDSVKKGKYYSYNAIRKGKDNKVEWVLLTNGYKWRIYNTTNISPYENYLEVDIEASIKSNNEADEAFKLFYLFFNVRTYYLEDDGELMIEKIKEASGKKAESIEDFLRGKSEEILTYLCYGLKENMNKEFFTDEDRRNIYKDAITLLYRMLFFGYAESRGLLPVRENDPEYVISFSKLCEDAKNEQNSGDILDIKDGYEYWDKLDEFLRIYVDQSYNGGLFNNEDKPILREYKISNGYLAKCLAEISYNKDKNNIFTEKIEYKDLSVRNLGAIYEGLLEYQLFIAGERLVIKRSNGKIKYVKASETKLTRSDVKNIIEPGQVYLSQDASERKDTGSYYTPEDVVEYIVGNTVGKKLEELKSELRESLHELYAQLNYAPSESSRRIIINHIDEKILDFVEKKILDVSIIDSAMGSGHFLVNAAYRLANGIVEIICENNWESDIEIEVNIKYWKRKVVENCIYGIDINELAVALARLSLWLISASNDKALSFIDHHLKVGDSIIGTDRKHIELTHDDKERTFFDVSYDSMIQPILGKYEEIRAIGSNTKGDVELQNDIYKQIQEEIKLLKMKFNYYLASQYAGGIEDADQYALIMNSKSYETFEKEGIKELLQYANDNKFFHWELEFPEVLQKGGFDIVIGNPPYVDVKESDYKYTTLDFPGTRNLYSYMIDHNLRIVKKKNFKMAYIIPISLVSSDRMKKLRERLLNVKEAKISFINIDSSKNPGTLFKDVITRVSIFSIDKNKYENNSCTTTSNYLKFYMSDRKRLLHNLNTVNLDQSYMIEGIIPKIGHEIEKNILEKILSKTKTTIKNYAVDNNPENRMYFKRLGITYYATGFSTPPLFILNGEKRISTTLDSIDLIDGAPKYIPLCLLYSSLFYWFLTAYSNCYDLKKNDIYRLPINILDKTFNIDEFKHLFLEIEGSMKKNARIVTYNKRLGKTQYAEFRPRKSKSLFDRVDKLLANYYGFSGDEYNYIVNYDFKFRTDTTE